MEASVHITGYVGTEVEQRGGGAVARFRLGCTPRVKVRGEWTDGATTWLDVTCFRALAEHVATSVRKGDPVLVVGRLRTSTWERDGVPHERLVLQADAVGHDLTRGTSSFRRHVRAAEPRAGEPPEDELDEAGASAEERAAQAA